MATYYRPYLPSDSELSDAEYDSDYSDASALQRPDNAGPDIEGPDFAALANALNANLAESAGPSLTEPQQIAYGENRLDSRTSYSAYGMTDLSGQLTTVGTDTPTIVMLQSRDRDKIIFTQPTNCKLFLPRIYKNITGFSIVQLNLTSSFYYFRANKYNLDIEIQEEGRVLYGADKLDSTSSPATIKNVLKLKNQIREGSYNITELLTELSTQLNRTPLFYDFINGFSDFLSAFSVNGDYSLNFNEPGDNYYDAVRKIYINNPTREIITSFYFQARYALQYTFTEQQVMNAYYYPVIKEVLFDPAEDVSKYNLSYTDKRVYDRDEVIKYLKFSFTGIDDPIATEIINNNLDNLNRYRLYHTFRYSLINKYTCTYTPSNNRVNINTPSLNTSLTNMLITQYNSYLDQQLITRNITREQYNSLSTDIITLLSIIQNMYDYMQENFAKYFAIDYGKYSRDYFTNMNNSLDLRPGLDAKGIKTRATAGSKPVTKDILQNYKEEPPHFWPFMKQLGNTISYTTDPRDTFNMGAARQTYPNSLNKPYILSSSNIDVYRDFIDSSGTIYTDYRRKAGDILVNVEAGKYTVFKFRSPVRQSLQIETLPRHTNFRYPIWNKNNVVNTPVEEIFDISYCFVNPVKDSVLETNIKNIPYKPLYGWSTITGDGTDNIWNYSTNFTASYQTSLDFWDRGNNAEELNSTNPNGYYYRFIAPYTMSRESKGSKVYTYNYSVRIKPVALSVNPLVNSSLVDTTLPVDFYAFFYHDVTAFYADIHFKGGRNEDPNHYKHKLVIPANKNLNTNLELFTYTFKAYAGQNYYMIIRSSTTISPSVKFKVIPFCPDGDKTEQVVDATIDDPLQDPMTMLNNFNVAKNADPAFIRLPVSTIVNAPDPENIKINKFPDINALEIGYDQNGVSNDLTDYIPFNPFETISTILPSATILIDPLTDYVFQYNTKYDLTKNSYFTSNTSNFIFEPSAVKQYTPGKIEKRQTKIVQYYATHYLRDTGEVTYSSDDISTHVKVYDASTTNGNLVGYKYEKGPLELGQGVTGFTFLPSDGTWDLYRISFKTNFVTASAVNSKIHCLGIFITSDIYTLPISLISLNNAVAIFLRVQDKIYTKDNQNLGFDAGLGTYHTFSNVPSLLVRKVLINGSLQKIDINGFSQGKREFIGDVNTYYSAVAFTFTDLTGLTDLTTWNMPNNDDTATVKADKIRANIAIAQTSIKNNSAEVTNIQNMVGTPIPYPFAGTASVSQEFYDGSKTPTGADLVRSSVIPYGDPYGPDPDLAIDETVSQYAQSVPIVNSHIHYLIPQNIISDEFGFSRWNGLPSSVDYIHPYVIDNSERTYINTINARDTYKYKYGYALIQGSEFTLVKYKIFTKMGPFRVANSDQRADRNFITVGQITAQQIFPDGENTSLISVSGTPSHFVFLGASNIPGQTYSQLRFKKYDPLGGSITELPIISLYTFPNSYNLQHFVFNSSNTWFYTASIAHTDTIVLKGTTNYGSLNQFDNITKTYTSVTQSQLQLEATGFNIYLSVYNLPGFSTIRIFSLDPLKESYIGRPGNDTIINLDIKVPPDRYPYYTHFAVSNNTGNEEVLLLNTEYDPSIYFKIRNYQATNTRTMSNANIDFSKQFFKDSSDKKIGVKQLIGGLNGSKWVLSDSPPYILGNRNDSYDAPIALAIAWQIFFPTMKIEMIKEKSGFTPIEDLTNIKYPEWPHSMMFAYSNYTSFSNDILSEGGKWGLENKSNYFVSDVKFSGYDFNSYLANIPLQSNIGLTDSNEYFYVALRGYLPTESFQTMMRFYLPNRYDFGFVRLADIAREIPLAIASSSNFNPLYRDTLLPFNSNFVFTSKNFGSNSLQGVAGSNITSTSFSNFMSQYIDYYSTFQGKSDALTDINSNVKKYINSFINENLQYILPTSALSRQRFIDPILSKILWQENLDNNRKDLDDEWGLGWNLGFSKKDTEFSTSHSAESFYKINQDYIYLRLNPEFNINGMDAGGKENYKTSREPSGTTKQYYCKLLLTSFGGNATTFIHNPIKFNPPINRITNLHFQWIDSKGVLIDNADCEWDMTVNITETSEISKIPSKMEFKLEDSMGVPAPVPAGKSDFAEKRSTT